LLLAVETGYLLTGPVFISHYSGWIAPGGAIVLGTAAAVLVSALDRSRLTARLCRGAALLALGLVALTAIQPQGIAIDRAALEHDIRDARCVSSDSAVLLVETSGLLRDLQAGCHLVLDPTGTAYDTDRGHLAPGPVGAARLAAPGYQRAMEAYYAGSDAALFTRPADGLTDATRAAIARTLPVVVTRDAVTVHLPAGAGP
jgi:hypothetical protein